MPGAVDQFRYISYPQEIIFAPGALTRLSEAVERYGWQRLMLCTNRSMQAGGHVSTVEAILGDRLVAAFDQVHPHVQDVQVDEALRLASESDVEAIIGMGGGSPLGMAKATAYKLAEVRSGDQARAGAPGEKARVPVIAIPTTYAGSEMTPVYGITHTRGDASPQSHRQRPAGHAEARHLRPAADARPAPRADGLFRDQRAGALHRSSVFDQPATRSRPRLRCAG